MYGFLGGGRVALLSEATSVDGGGLRVTRATGAWSAAWYREHFTHWVIHIVHFSSRTRAAFVPERSRSGQRSEGCPYPYVTLYQVVSYARLDQDTSLETS